MGSLIVLAVWTIVIVRAISARATLRPRTLLTYIATGALLAPVVAPLIYKAVSPYGNSGPLTKEIVAGCTQVALLAPVLPYLLSRRLRAMTSVADAFLLGFLVGLGFDLMGAVLVASANGDIPGLRAWPPFQLDAQGISIAGDSYWTGLLALTLAAGLRFTRRFIALPPALLVFLWMVTEQAALSTVPDTTNPAQWLGPWASRFQNGTLTAWIALAALVSFQILEGYWAAHASGRAPNIRTMMKGVVLLLRTAVGGRFREYHHLANMAIARRQAQLVATEAAFAPSDVALQRLKLRLDTRVRQGESRVVPVATGWIELPREITDEVRRRLGRARAWLSPPAGGFLASLRWLMDRLSHLWRSPIPLQAVAIVLLVLLAVSVPWLPSDLPGNLAASQLVSWQFSILTVGNLGAVVMLFILWRYLQSAGEPRSEADSDDAIRYHGERAILTVALGAVLVLFAYSPAENLYPFATLVSYYTGLAPPPFQRIQISTLLLLFAFVSTGLTLARARHWRSRPMTERRATALRNVVAVASACVLLWVSLGLYTPVLQDFQNRFGPDFLARFGGGALGNTAVAVSAMLLVGGVSLTLAIVLHIVSNRIEHFFIDEEPMPVRKQV